MAKKPDSSAEAIEAPAVSSPVLETFFFPTIGPEGISVQAESREAALAIAEKIAANLSPLKHGQ